MISVKFLIAIACLVIAFGWTNGAPLELEESNGLQAWESFLETYNKTYATDEEYNMRKEQFLKNFKPLVLQNKKFLSQQSTYEVGINEFSDLSSEEFRSLYTGLAPLNGTIESDLQDIPPPMNLALPTNFDWRPYNILTLVKNQGACGSCWAFATIATLEARFNRRSCSPVHHLSEQYLVDCDRASNQGCNGGWPHDALRYILGRGAALRQAYPYTAVQGSCRNMAVDTYRNFQIGVWENLNDVTLRTYLVNYGPLVVSVDGSAIQSYRSGVFNSQSCKEVNHVVNLIGYVTSGPEAPYYILRNSWGTGWGESGNFRVSANNPCLTRNYVVAVI